MIQYEVTFVADPVLSSDESKTVMQTYVDFLKAEGATIVNVEEAGLRQLAYVIKKRASGVYYCIEFQVPQGGMLEKMELNMRRDERLLRFLTIRLDKYGVKYNEDKRAGKIGKRKKTEDALKSEIASEVAAEPKENTRPARAPRQQAQ
jgi:small subunit ribosomal protein S6